MAHSNLYKTYIISSVWREKSKYCQSLTRNHCILIPWLRSNHCHHLTYRNLQNEIPVRDTVALSKIAHGVIHCKILWKSPLRVGVNYFLRICMICSILFWNTIGLIIPVPCKSNKPKLRRK